MKSNAKQLTILGLMVAVLIIFAFTPIGTIPIGPLSISLQVIPVAICAVVLGPKGGAIAGAIFGILSFLQALGIGIPSGMGAAFVAINPFFAFVQRFVPRVLDGLIVGFIFKAIRKKNVYVASAVTGFFTAFLNTLLFMSALVLLFGSSDYVQEKVAALGTGSNWFLFVVLFVGINAVVEMVAATVVTGAVGAALYKAKIIGPGSK